MSTDRKCANTLHASPTGLEVFAGEAANKGKKRHPCEGSEYGNGFEVFLRAETTPRASGEKSHLLEKRQPIQSGSAR